MQNQLVIDKARSLYLKHNGRHHRLLEKEMHDLGCLRFTRRSLYNQRTKTGLRLGWIERFKWRDELRRLLSPKGTLEASGTDKIHYPEKTICAPQPDLTLQTSERRPPTSFQEWLKHVSPNMTWSWPYQKLIYEKLQQVTD